MDCLEQEQPEYSLNERIMQLEKCMFLMSPNSGGEGGWRGERGNINAPRQLMGESIVFVWARAGLALYCNIVSMGNDGF